MVCIYCSTKTNVSNSRLQKRLNRVWRRRQCPSCGAVFSTLETADLSTSLVVVGTNNHIEPYERDKLFLSLYRSLEHRRDAVAAADALTATTTAKLLKIVQKASVTTKKLAGSAYEVLRHFDADAATHYRAHHKHLL